MERCQSWPRIARWRRRLFTFGANFASGDLRLLAGVQPGSRAPGVAGPGPLVTGTQPGRYGMGPEMFSEGSGLGAEHELIWSVVWMRPSFWNTGQFWISPEPSVHACTARKHALVPPIEEVAVQPIAGRIPVCEYELPIVVQLVEWAHVEPHLIKDGDEVNWVRGRALATIDATRVRHMGLVV